MPKDFIEKLDKLFEKIKLEMGICDKCGARTSYFNSKEKLYLCLEHQPKNASVSVSTEVNQDTACKFMRVEFNLWEDQLKRKQRLKSNRKSKKRDVQKIENATRRRKAKKEKLG